jgi:protoporphyrinogen/coproporphyrinogen III oxidase
MNLDVRENASHGSPGHELRASVGGLTWLRKIVERWIARMSMGQPEPYCDARAELRAAKHIVIVGGGIAGLSAAWYLQQEAAQHDLPIRYTLVEESSRWGGKVHTERVPGFGDTSFILEAGPDALLTYKPWAVTLARELGLEDHLVGGNPANSRTFVLHRGHMVALPAGLQLLVPTKFWPFVRSRLFSWRGKLRVALETRIPARCDAADESLADFVRRRFGSEALETLAEPLMSDVYNVSSSRQSIMATFPQYPALEARYGSVIRGSLAATRQRQRQSSRSATPSPPFVSLHGGTQSLVDALLSKLTGDLRLRSAVDRVLRTADDSYQVVLADGSRLDADVVILATPARVSASLLASIAPSASASLGEIGYTSIGNAYLAFRRQDVSHPLDGYGMVIPRAEGRRIDGMSWTSSKWIGRAPDDYVLLRVFFGGPHTRDLMTLDDATLLAVVRAEVAALLGVRASPVFQRVYRWPDGYPQYEVGHLARVDAIEAALPTGIYVTGSAYRGIGVPDCVRQGQESAGRTVTALIATPAPQLASIAEPPQAGR